MKACSLASCGVSFPEDLVISEDHGGACCAACAAKGPKAGGARNPFGKKSAAKGSCCGGDAEVIDAVGVAIPTTTVVVKEQVSPEVVESVLESTPYPVPVYNDDVVVTKSAGLPSPFKRSAGRSAGISRSGAVMPVGWRPAGWSPAPDGSNSPERIWASMPPGTQANEISAWESSHRPIGSGTTANDPNAVALPADMAQQYSGAQWAQLTPEQRREAIDTARNPSPAQQVFTAILAAANLTIGTWMTMDQRDRDQRQNELRAAADARQQDILNQIRLQGGTPNPAQQAQLDALAGGLNGLIASINAQAAAPKGPSTALVVGVVAGGALLLGVVALVVMRPRRNPSRPSWIPKVPQLHGVYVPRRGSR